MRSLWDGKTHLQNTASLLKFLGPLTLFHTSGGHYGSDDHKQPCCVYMERARTTKILDFVPVYVWMVPEKSFLEFVLEIFEKWNFFLTFSISNWKYKKKFFWKKIMFFLFEFVVYMFLALFEVYNSRVSKKFKFDHIFAWKISFFATVFWQPVWLKL